MNRKIILFLMFVLPASFAFSQTTTKNAGKTSEQIKSTAAFAEVLLRRVERESELEELLLNYQEEFPKVKALRFEVALLQKELDNLLAVSASDAGKLTLALGKLLVRKIELETDLWKLRQQYSADHPEAKRARRKIETYERAIKEIL